MTATSRAAGVSGSAKRWGPLWGARPSDWALSEDQQTPTYEEALRRVDLKPGQFVLDIGCGVGAFLRLIADRGARAFGLDASEALLEVARARLPDADLRLGDMEALPYEDHTFELVTGFNSFFFANDIVAALREAGRVAKPGAPVVIQVWGPHERNDLEAMKGIVRPFMPARPAGAAPDPDEETLRRALVAPAGIAVLVGPDREEEVKDAISAGLATYRTADGSYRLHNTFHYLIARA